MHNGGEIMNSFERFGIKHLSPSSLNKAQGCLGAWIVSYLFKIYDNAGLNAARGICVEHGVQSCLEDEFLDALEEATKKFNSTTAMGFPQDQRKKHLDEFPGFIEQTLEGLKNYAEPTGYQEKVVINLDNVPVPILGFTDFTFDDDGKVVDLKTTKAIPGKMSAPHKRQMAVYQHAKSNHSIDVLYASPKKHAIYTLQPDEAKKSLEEIRQIAMRLERFLDKFETKEEVANAVIPDYDMFYFSGAAFRAKAKEIFGY